MLLDDQWPPRPPVDDPGVLPTGPILHQARAEVVHRPSVPLGKLRVNRVSSPRQFPVWLTGRQSTCTSRHPSQLRVSTLRGSTGSVLRIVSTREACRPSVPHACAVCCPASRAFFATDDQVCFCPSRLGPGSSCHPSHFQPPPLVLNVTPLILAGSRSTTDQSAQGTPEPQSDDARPGICRSASEAKISP